MSSEGSVLEIGDVAPGFTLLNQHGIEVSLSDFRQQSPVMLVFYPFAFSGICTGELCQLRDSFPIFSNSNVEVLGISVDSHFALKAFAQQESYSFSLLSDFWPHGEVAKDYGVFIEETGMASRATFLIDTQGVVIDKTVSALDQPRTLSFYSDAITGLG